MILEFSRDTYYFNNNIHLSHLKISISKIESSISRINEFLKLGIFSGVNNNNPNSIFDISEGYLFISQLEASGMIGSPLDSKCSFLVELIDKFLRNKKISNFRDILEFISDFFGSLSNIIPYLDEVKEWFDLFSKLEFDLNIRQKFKEFIESLRPDLDTILI